MTGYPLRDLLRIRELRENAAAGEMARKRHDLQAAEQTLEDRKAELRDYIAWRYREEDRLYAEVKGKAVHGRELEAYRDRIVEMRQYQPILEEKVTKAEEFREQAEKALERAREAFQQAVKEKMKLEEHRKRWLHEQTRLLSLEQDKELEEFQSRTSHPEFFEAPEAEEEVEV